ncbi:speedy protein A-like [Macrosteles quadrilineatus]|uniref:speedy protein A-like n=1 Tax=Macrosteles quadrilineatus TaxID=74068 RepID=UPI0023E336F9|nr:speedy protein A-like [Macrosteles quadrilineatus]
MAAVESRKRIQSFFNENDLDDEEIITLLNNRSTRSHIIRIGSSLSQEFFSSYQITQFLILTRDKIIVEFLKYDRCCLLADKYLLSMVFVYFIRARLPLSDYTRLNFFVALYLAHDMEEDNEDLKIDFVDWGLGAAEKADVARFITLRDTMWMAMNYRACVSLRTCHEVMEVLGNGDLWKRERDPVHGGATRDNDQKEREQCQRCTYPTSRYYGSDLDSSFDSDSGESDSDDIFSHSSAKRAREE